MKNLLKTLFAAFALTASAVEFGDITADYPLYLANDPFAIGLARTNAAVKVNINAGTSTNQTLVTATVPTYMTFTTNAVGTLTTGQISWDSDWMTFKFGLGNGVQGQAFQEGHVVAKNVWTNTILNGWAVMHSGAVGNSGKFEVVPAISTAGMRRGAVLGLATEDIPVGAMGRITRSGNVNEIGSDGSDYGTSGWQDNQPVYLSKDHVGYLVTNAPPAPYSSILMGNVINAHSSGAIYVDVRCGIALQDLDNVDGTPLTDSGQFPVWDNVRQVFDFTGDTNRFLTAEYTPTLLGDRVDSDVFTTFDNGTGTVWRVAPIVTNFTVTLSADFEETEGHTKPFTGTNEFPFSIGDWSGYVFVGDDVPYNRITHSSLGADWLSEAHPSYPSTLIAANPFSQGTATVYRTITRATNAVFTLATTNHVELLRAWTRSEIDAATNAVLASVMAEIENSSETVYGDLSVTNTAGFAAFSVTNGAQSAKTAVESNVAGTNTLSFAYPFTNEHRTAGATCVTYAILGNGTTVARSVLYLLNAGGTAVASNVYNAVDAGSLALPYFTNTLAYTGAPVTSGTYVVALTLGKSDAFLGHAVYTGGDYPMALTLSTVPIDYATTGELAEKADSASTITINGVSGNLSSNLAWTVDGGGINSQDIKIFSCTNFVSVMNLFRITGTPNALRSFDYIAGDGYGFSAPSNSSTTVGDVYSVVPPCVSGGYTTLVSRVTMYCASAENGHRANLRADVFTLTSSAIQSISSYGLFTNGVCEVYVTNSFSVPARVSYANLSGDLSDTAPTRLWKNVEHAWIRP